MLKPEKNNLKGRIMKNNNNLINIPKKEAPKLLAPAGDFIALRSAIDAGADEIYFGIKGFNMRAGAKNFQKKDLQKIISICHEKNVKAYLALNTIVYENEINKINSIIRKAKEYKIDAIICWDFSVIELCEKYDVKVHISTQASISNYEAIKSLKKRYPHIERIVLARECSLKDIKNIIKKIKKDNLEVEIEVFIHGAMCVSESGRCFMSHEIFGKSANRGECLQPCRRKYEVYIKDTEEKHELLLGKDYVMSPKDLCAMPIIDKIIDSGANALKIEGRNKNPEYVYTVVSSYRKIIDEYLKNNKKEHIDELKNNLINNLSKVYNRGFSTGFYLGKPINEWTHDYGSSSKETKTYVGKVVNYYSKNEVAEILIESTPLNEGDEILIQGITTGLLRQKAENILFDNVNVSKSDKKTVTLKVLKKVRRNDKVYKIIQRENKESFN
ncbi:MAG: peptidase U32 family protein [Candidatus Woesearchaeota archaeon]